MSRSIHHSVRSKDQGRAESYAKRSGYKRGGAVHEDAAEDKKLIGEMIAKSKRPKRKRGGSVPGQAVVGRLDKKPRGAKSAEQVYDTAGRTDVQKAKITDAPAHPLKRATGGKISRAVTGPQNHNGMGRLANLGKFAHGGKIKRDIGGSVTPGSMGAVPARPSDVMMPQPPMKKGGSVKRAAGGRVKKPTVSPTSTEVRSPTSTSTKAHTSDNVTVTGGAGDGDTSVHIHSGSKPAAFEKIPEDAKMDKKRGGKVTKRARGGRVPKVNIVVNAGGKPAGDDPAKAILPALLAAKAGGAGGPPPGMPPAPPPGMPPGLPPGLPGGAPPPMMRKAGGRIPEARMGVKTIPMPQKIAVRGYERRKGGKVC